MDRYSAAWIIVGYQNHLLSLIRFIARVNKRPVYVYHEEENVLMIKSSLMGMRAFLNGSQMHFN